MGKQLEPVASNLLTANGQQWVDFLQKLQNHFANTSTTWNVDSFTDDTGGSGDYGLTISPADSNENFQMNIRYDADAVTGGRVFGLIDPNANITNDLDPVNNSSSAASNERDYIGESFSNNSNWNNNPPFISDFLLCEWSDAIWVGFKNTQNLRGNSNPANNYVPWGWHMGRIVVGFFDNDASFRSIDGLGLTGGAPNANSNSDFGAKREFFSGDGTGNTPSEIRVPNDEWAHVGSTQDTNYSDNTELFWSDGSFSPEPAVLFDNNSNNRCFCYTKYYMHTTRQGTNNGGGNYGLERISDPNTGNGFLFTSFDGNQYLASIPWDPSVSPV